ncbi:hypothetical protein C7C46_20480 [Streptomyces tateyamensis]|uniref:Uncharacterized protein n=1 Tax=Streptomyces tateyamensis TaxID=565073 RepID=A0A2V4NCY3_9ACTN|nr:hypothetical protein [Streptomyces tateyamensis]PYC77008.1 hypothetical protein C7C46_20480 [Streptomyces tateyamensis]
MAPRAEFDEDFGITGLTKYLKPPYVPGDEAGCLGMAELLFDQEGPVYAEEVLADVRTLVGSALSDEVLATVWLTATRAHFDPVGTGVGIRPWLNRLAEVSESAIRQEPGAAAPARPAPAGDPQLRAAVLAELGGVGPALAEAAVTSRYAPPLSQAVPALVAAVTELPVDLGFRLLLRALKAYFVPIGPGRRARFKEIGRQLGYHPLVVGDGGLNIWSDLVD